MIFKKALYTFLTLSVLIFLFASCNKDEGPWPGKIPTVSGGTDTTDTTQNNQAEISYKKDVQSIFNSRCTACHSELHAKLNLLTCCSHEMLTSTGFNAPYIDVQKPENSRLYKHLSGELMLMPPSGKLSEVQIQKIANWMRQGAKNN